MEECYGHLYFIFSGSFTLKSSEKMSELIFRTSEPVVLRQSLPQNAGII